MNTELHPEVLDTSSRRIRSGAWRDEAKSRATRLRTEARWLELRDEVLRKARGEPMRVEIFTPLDRVDQLAGQDRVRFREWLSGSQVEECWRLLRQAEEGVLQAVADDGVAARSQGAIAHGEERLGRDHVLVTSLQSHLDLGSPPAALRIAALDVVRASHEVSDRRHRLMRLFRNQLIGVTTALVLLAGAALLGQFLINENRLVPAPADAELSPTIALAMVMFSGCIGALFSAVPSLSEIPETASPFNMARQQAYLKIATGAWSAVVGLLVVNAGLVSTEAGTGAASTSLGGLVILAALFGAGQEAVTRFADNKARDLLRSD